MVSVRFQVTTPAPRRTRHDGGQVDGCQAGGEALGLLRRDDELEVRPPRREAQRAARQEEAAQVRHAAVAGARGPT